MRGRARVRTGQLRGARALRVASRARAHLQKGRLAVAGWGQQESRRARVHRADAVLRRLRRVRQTEQPRRRIKGGQRRDGVAHLQDRELFMLVLLLHHRLVRLLSDSQRQADYPTYAPGVRFCGVVLRVALLGSDWEPVENEVGMFRRYVFPESHG